MNRSHNMLTRKYTVRLLKKIGVVALLALVFGHTGLGQAAKTQRNSRQQGWSAAEVQNWVDNSGGRLMVDPACPDFTDRRDAILNGNKITTQIFNFGSISAPGNVITDIVWNGLGYGYEFGPFVAAEVVDEGHLDRQSIIKRDASGGVAYDAQGDTVWVTRIVSDGLTSNGGEVSPDGSERWGWHPIPCAQPVGGFAGIQVVNPNSNKIPTSSAPDEDLDGKPDSWPEEWYNENLEAYVWPGALQQGASNADQEAIYFMNDYSNNEFEYAPFPSDSTKKGLGLEVEVRLYQWANPLGEDAIFLIYKITNKSEKDLDETIFGMWGDPHVGGPRNWQDDLAFFDKDLNMVFAFDDDGRSDIAGKKPGYFGYKFLESPGVGNETINGVSYPGDGIDNDNDGLLDESWTDGIDNDGDWNPDTDDVGLDGLTGTGDEGEGDGIPTSGDPFDITKPGEPNFEFTDIDESDMIGLTSFASPPFAGNRIDNDDRVWDFVQPGRFDDIPEEPGDYVFLYGSGKFALRAGETKRFSIALVIGENLEDLILNAETVQQIYDVGYRFAKPPEKPNVRVVPGDEKVTLYWDKRAEDSVDPLTNDKDFEGYVVYRSTDHEFADQQTITDINGTRFLYQPLRNEVGVEARFDLKNGIFGPSPVAFPRRGVSYDLGDDTGLFHTYVDSNRVVNGQTYYYSVVAYDRGFFGDEESGITGGIPPSETTKTITYNPTTDSYIYDVNSQSVIPGPPSAGYVPPSIEAAGGLIHETGAGTGTIDIEIVDELAVPDGGSFRIEFVDLGEDLIGYSIFDEVPVSVTFAANPGKNSVLGYRNINPASFSIPGLTSGTDYELNAALGAVQIVGGASAGQELTATFEYAPVFRSALMAGEEGNDVFDGLHVFVADNELALDEAQTGWVQGGGGAVFEARVALAGPGRVPQASDYEIQFTNSPVTEAISSNLPLPFRIINITQANQQIDAFVPDLNRDGAWNVNESIIFIEQIDGKTTATWQVQFEEDSPLPGDGDVFYLRTTKPFGVTDKFRFKTAGAHVATEEVAEKMRDIYVVPNPYVATNELEPKNPVSRFERGYRRLYFANVPAQCTIRIYTLAGELVETLEHNSSIDDGKVFWDMRTKDNMNIAYGLYIYHVESEEGTFIDKFAVIK